MDEKLIAATTKLAKSTGLTVGAGTNDTIIIYLTDDFIPDYIPVDYEGYPVVTKKIGRIVAANT